MHFDIISIFHFKTNLSAETSILKVMFLLWVADPFDTECFPEDISDCECQDKATISHLALTFVFRYVWSPPPEVYFIVPMFLLDTVPMVIPGAHDQPLVSHQTGPP